MDAVPKRHYGTGSLRLRRRVWYARLRAPDGRQIEISTHTTDRVAAERFLWEKLGQVARGEFVGPEKITLGDLLDDLLSEYERQGRKSLPQLKSRIKQLEPLRSLKAARLRARGLDAYQQKRAESGAAPATVNRELETVRRALTLGVENELVARVPKFRFLDADNVRMGYLDHDDYARLRDRLAEPIRLMFTIAYHVGARAGAARSLTWDRVDLDGKIIYPPGAQARNKRVGAWPIYGDLERALREAQFIRERDGINCRWVVHRHGRQVVDYRDAWDEGCRAAGLPGLRFHDLRRSAVRNLLDSGLDESTVMKIIGHRTRAMLDRYNIVDPKAIRRAGEKLDRWSDERLRDSRVAKPPTALN